MATSLWLVAAAAVLHCAAATVVYKYEGQAVMGIPESGRDYNVLRIEFNIAATRVGSALTTASSVIVNVDPTTIKVHNFTGRIFPAPEGVLPIDGMTETVLRATSKQNLAAQLAKPMVITRDETTGQVSGIRHDPTDPFWSVNLKKGALSLFQINIQADSGVYTVPETDITGSCPSTYLVQSREHYHGHDHATPSWLNVTKSRDYSKCANRTILRHSFFSGMRLSDEEFAEKNIISNAKFAYNISGTRAAGRGLLIESACSEGQHIFTMFKPLSGSLTVYTHQRATLLSKTADTASGMLTTPLMDCTFAMKMPNVITAGTDFKFTDDEVVPQVRDAVAGLVDPNLPAHMKGMLLNRIIERMRGARLTAWETIGQAALASSPARLKLLLDLAPSTGTLESLQKFQGVLPRLTPNITAQFFALSGLFGEPTFQMISTMKSICDSASVRETFRETKACLLSFASMAHNRYFRSNYYLKNASFPADELAAIADVVNRINSTFQEIFSSNNVSRQLLWVKFAGNLGAPNIIPMLYSVANNESNAIVVRVHAIRAFRRMPVAFAETIQKLLLPIFTDWHNDVEVRIAAFRAVIMTRPSQGIIDLISTALHHEHDEHVRTYVYSVFKIITKNPIVDNIALSDRARIALQGLSSILPLGLQYSRVYRLIDTYDDDRNAGFALDLSVVGTTRSLLPREVCIWGHGVAFGVQSNMFHGCLRLQGIQKILTKMFRSGAPVFPDFFSQLNLNQIEFENYHGMWDFSLEGSELQFMEIPPVISQALGDPAAMQERVAGLVRMLRTPIFKTIAFDSTLQVPSLIGLPVQQNNTYVMLLNVSLGNVSLVPACRFNAYQPCTVTLQPQGVHRIASQHVLGVDAGIVQSKVMLHGMAFRQRGGDGYNRNWTISYMANAQNTTVSFEADLPRQRVSTARTELMPLLVTVDRTKANLLEQFYVKDLESWHSGALPERNFNFALNSTAKVTGFLFGFNKTKTLCAPFFMLPANKPAEPFCGKVTRDFYVIPQADAPDKFRITLRKVGPPIATVQATSFRSDDSFDMVNEEEEEEVDHEHTMMDDLAQLSSRLNAEMEEVDELREHLESEREAELESESESETESASDEQNVIDDDDEHEEEVLVRRRRATDRRKDRKPSVGKDRKRRPEAIDDPEVPEKTRPAGDSSSMKLEIVGLRNGVESRKLELAISRAPTAQPRQYQREFKLKITAGSRQVASVCGKAQVQYPKNHVSLSPGATSEEPYWSYSAKVEYGTERCDDDKTFELKLNFSRSAEQIQATQLFRARSPAANRFYPVAMCNAELAKGQVYTWPCRHLFMQLNDAHRTTISVKASDVKKLSIGGLDFRNWIAAGMLHLRVHYWKNLQTAFVRDIKENSKELTLFSERNFQLPLLADFSISTPESTNDFRSVFMRRHAPSLYFPTYLSLAYHLSGFRIPGVCVSHRVSDSRVYISTFDNVVYNITPPTCPDGTELNVLIAGDCSSASKFAVSLNFQTTTKQMELRIDTAAHPVKLRPFAKTGGAEIYVDNVKVTDEKYEISSGGSGLQITNRNNLVYVRFDIGLFVTLTPDYGVMIGLSPLYSGLTCGLCGDYNGQRLDEFTMADGTLTDDSTAFHNSFVAGGQACTA